MSKKYQIVSFGEALIDFTPTTGGAYMPNPGGAPFNLAVCASKFGVKTAFVGKIGNDAFGTLIASTAKNASLDTAGLLVDDKRVTTHAFVTLDENGDRDFVFCRDHGADLALSLEELPINLVSDTRIFHFGGLSFTHEDIKKCCYKAVDTALEQGAIISFDPNYRALLWSSPSAFVRECSAVLDKVDVLKVSLEEALMLTGTDTEEKAVSVLNKRKGITLITKGKEGAVCIHKGESQNVPSVKVNTVDTTGAGDVFFGVFLSLLVNENCGIDELSRCALYRITEKACYYAAKSTEKYGAIPAIPSFLVEN